MGSPITTRRSNIDSKNNRTSSGDAQREVDQPIWLEAEALFLAGIKNGFRSVLIRAIENYTYLSEHIEKGLVYALYDEELAKKLLVDLSDDDIKQKQETLLKQLQVLNDIDANKLANLLNFCFYLASNNLPTLDELTNLTRKICQETHVNYTKLKDSLEKYEAEYQILRRNYLTDANSTAAETGRELTRAYRNVFFRLAKLAREIADAPNNCQANSSLLLTERDYSQQALAVLCSKLNELINIANGTLDNVEQQLARVALGGINDEYVNINHIHDRCRMHLVFYLGNTEVNIDDFFSDKLMNKNKRLKLFITSMLTQATINWLRENYIHQLWFGDSDFSLLALADSTIIVRFDPATSILRVRVEANNPKQRIKNKASFYPWPTQVFVAVEFMFEVMGIKNSHTTVIKPSWEKTQAVLAIIPGMDKQLKVAPGLLKAPAKQHEIVHWLLGYEKQLCEFIQQEAGMLPLSELLEVCKLQDAEEQQLIERFKAGFYTSPKAPDYVDTCNAIIAFIRNKLNTAQGSISLSDSWRWLQLINIAIGICENTDPLLTELSEFKVRLINNITEFIQAPKHFNPEDMTCIKGLFSLHASTNTPENWMLHVLIQWKDVLQNYLENLEKTGNAQNLVYVNAILIQAITLSDEQRNSLGITEDKIEKLLLSLELERSKWLVREKDNLDDFFQKVLDSLIGVDGLLNSRTLLQRLQEGNSLANKINALVLDTAFCYSMFFKQMVEPTNNIAPNINVKLTLRYSQGLVDIFNLLLTNGKKQLPWVNCQAFALAITSYVNLRRVIQRSPRLLPREIEPAVNQFGANLKFYLVAGLKNSRITLSPPKDSNFTDMLLEVATISALSVDTSELALASVACRYLEQKFPANASGLVEIKRNLSANVMRAARYSIEQQSEVAIQQYIELQSVLLEVEVKDVDILLASVLGMLHIINSLNTQAHVYRADSEQILTQCSTSYANVLEKLLKSLRGVILTRDQQDNLIKLFALNANFMRGASQWLSDKQLELGKIILNSANLSQQQLETFDRVVIKIMPYVPAVTSLCQIALPANDVLVSDIEGVGANQKYQRQASDALRPGTGLTGSAERACKLLLSLPQLGAEKRRELISQLDHVKPATQASAGSKLGKLACQIVVDEIDTRTLSNKVLVNLASYSPEASYVTAELLAEEIDKTLFSKVWDKVKLAGKKLKNWIGSCLGGNYRPQVDEDPDKTAEAYLTNAKNLIVANVQCAVRFFKKDVWLALIKKCGEQRVAELLLEIFGALQTEDRRCDRYKLINLVASQPHVAQSLLKLDQAVLQQKDGALQKALATSPLAVFFMLKDTPGFYEKLCTSNNEALEAYAQAYGVLYRKTWGPVNFKNAHAMMQWAYGLRQIAKPLTPNELRHYQMSISHLQHTEQALGRLLDSYMWHGQKDKVRSINQEFWSRLLCNQLPVARVWVINHLISEMRPDLDRYALRQQEYNDIRRYLREIPKAAELLQTLEEKYNKLAIGSSAVSIISDFPEPNAKSPIVPEPVLSVVAAPGIRLVH